MHAAGMRNVAAHVSVCANERCRHLLLLLWCERTIFIERSSFGVFVPALDAHTHTHAGLDWDGMFVVHGLRIVGKCT